MILAQRLDVEEIRSPHGTFGQRSMQYSNAMNRLGADDFLMQELNRGPNTLTSKSNDADTTQAAVKSQGHE